MVKPMRATTQQQEGKGKTWAKEKKLEQKVKRNT
jgi:hypothetical protein